MGVMYVLIGSGSYVRKENVTGLTGSHRVSGGEHWDCGKGSIRAIKYYMGLYSIIRYYKVLYGIIKYYMVLYGIIWCEAPNFQRVQILYI